MRKAAYLSITAAQFKTSFLTFRRNSAKPATHYSRLVLNRYITQNHSIRTFSCIKGLLDAWCIFVIQRGPNIAYATNYLAQFLLQTLKDDQIGAKHVLRYLRETHKFDIYYSKNDNDAFEG